MMDFSSSRFSLKWDLENKVWTEVLKVTFLVKWMFSYFVSDKLAYEVMYIFIWQMLPKQLSNS